MRIKAIRGTKDILPTEVHTWRQLEEKARKLFTLYNYDEIRTPILEEARLFTRSIGESSDIVRKEMYAFLDRKERLLCLRPEATASVVRAYLEHDFDKGETLSKFFYIGPMFRAERPQAGRLRQFHHIGVEAIGCASPYLDAEVISLAVHILHTIGIEGFTVQLNSIGSQDDRHSYKTLIKKILNDELKKLCPDCQSRYKLNLLRIFDCKNPTCKKITHALPAITDSLSEKSKAHFDKVLEMLSLLKIPFEVNPHLVRGLDYYTHTCFEIVHSNLGAQNALGAGGRYDNLIQDLGGPEKPAVGFALGIERLIATLTETKNAVASKAKVYIAVLGDKAREYAFGLLKELRTEGVSCAMDYQDKSLKAQMRIAGKLEFKYVIIIGEDELKKQKLILRNMEDKSQKEVEAKLIVKELT